MPFSLYSAQQAQAQSSGDIWSALISIRNPGLATLRYAIESDPVVSRTQTFTPWVADLQAPDSVAGQPAQGQLVLSAVDQTVLDAIDGVEGVLSIDVELVIVSFPDDVLRDWLDLKCEGVQSDGQSLTFPIRASAYWEEMAPWLTYTPKLFPALFPGSRQTQVAP